MDIIYLTNNNTIIINKSKDKNNRFIKLIVITSYSNSIRPKTSIGRVSGVISDSLSSHRNISGKSLDIYF